MALKAKDIADQLGISTATVSLALNNKPGVSDETRQKILKLIDEMGYDTNALSKPALKNNKNIRLIVYKKHGSVVSDTPFFLELTEGIDMEARRNGFNLIISYINEAGNKAEVLRVIEENLPQGLLLLATEMQEEDLIPFTNLGIPLVVVDSYFERKKLDTIVINNVQGAYEATKYLIDMGHEEIGYLHSAVTINNFDERNEGFLKAFADHGRKPEEKYIFSLDSTMEGAYRDMKEIVSVRPSLPTAFFVDNDLIAFGAIKALKEAGYRVPEDISITGFDDMPFCSIIEPPLTTIRVFKQKIGMLAVKRLIDKMEGDIAEFIKIEVGTELIERRSVARRPEKSSSVNEK